MELDGLPSTVIPPPAVTLAFHLLTSKANQHICEPNYIYDQNCVKFPLLVFEIWCSQVFGMHRPTDRRRDPNTECLRTVYSTKQVSVVLFNL